MSEPTAPSADARFIPREDLKGFTSWKPDAFGDTRADPKRRVADQLGEVQAARQSGYQDGYRDGLAALENFKQSFAQQMAAQIGQLVAGFDAEFVRRRPGPFPGCGYRPRSPTAAR